VDDTLCSANIQVIARN